MFISAVPPALAKAFFVLLPSLTLNACNGLSYLHILYKP